MKTTATNRKLRQLLTAINSGHLIPRPDFQRRLVWANKHKLSFIKTVLEDFPFPEIYVAAGEVNPDTGEGFELLVDGQQRISTLHQYFSGSKELKLGDGIEPYSKLSSEAKINFLEYDVVVRDLGKMSIDSIKDIFTRINSTNYALNAMEIRNVRFEGEVKTFCEDLIQSSFMERHHVFSAAEARRMNDLRFVLTLIATMLEGFFDEDDELEAFLERYNDSFPVAEALTRRLTNVFNFMDACHFPPRSRVWKKADLFTLLVELDRALNKAGLELDAPLVGENLKGFYQSIDALTKIDNPDSLLTQYSRSAVQGTNHRASRLRRSEVIKLILEFESPIRWQFAINNFSDAFVSSMTEWFLERYEDPANGVPYSSEDGGYQYLFGGPYEASDVLQDEFPEMPYSLIEKATNKLNLMCFEWIKKNEY